MGAKGGSPPAPPPPMLMPAPVTQVMIPEQEPLPPYISPELEKALLPPVISDEDAAKKKKNKSLLLAEQGREGTIKNIVGPQGLGAIDPLNINVPKLGDKSTKPKTVGKKATGGLLAE